MKWTIGSWLPYVCTALYPNVFGSAHNRRCLLAYVRRPFFPSWRRRFAHQSHTQIKVLARILDQLGYQVDVMNYAAAPTLRGQYDLVIDIHPDRSKPYWNHLSPHAKKIIYYTGSFPEFQNRAEQKRINAVNRARGAAIIPRRQVPKIEKEVWQQFDALLLIGNAVTRKTFPAFVPSITLIPNTGDPMYPVLPTDKKSPKSFLYLASGGQVHKGLDVLLELFARHSEWELYVCSPFSRETDFVAAYQHELYETANIHPIGFLDPYSKRFREIAARCTYLLAPSCSEGMSGSVLLAMSAGIIPIASKECGVDGIPLFDSLSQHDIEQSIQVYSKKSKSWIKKESVRMRDVIQEKHSPKEYNYAVSKALQEVLLKKIYVSRETNTSS